MKIEVNHHCSDFNSYRAARVKSLFNAENGCDWSHTAELPIENMDWQIGLIVGASGSGKTSIGSKLFNKPIYDLYAGWDNNKPIVDCIAPESDFNAVTAATWFWATSGLDAGDICEQEIVKIDYGLRPREFYQSDIIPAMLRTLKRCLNNLQNGIIRRIPQVEKYSTYDAKIQASTK